MTFNVAVGVVDGLEVIDVDHDDADVVVIAAGAGDLLVQRAVLKRRAAALAKLYAQAPAPEVIVLEQWVAARK